MTTGKKDRLSSEDVLKGAVAGLVAGLAAAWVMNQFQAAWSTAAKRMSPPDDDERRRGGPPQQQIDPNATAMVAQAIAKRTIARSLTKEELGIAGPAVHYAFGGSIGALYGALAEAAPARPTAATGAAYGTLVWIAGDEVAVPLLGLSKPDSAYPLEAHAQAWASHIVYGVTTELVRRGVRRLM